LIGLSPTELVDCRLQERACARCSWPHQNQERSIACTRRSAPCARCLCLQNQERSIAFGARVTFLLRGQEKSNQKRRPPRLALVGHPAQQVREPGPGFSNGHPARAKRSRHPCRLPLRGLSSPTHRCTGEPGRAAGQSWPALDTQPLRGCESKRQNSGERLFKWEDRLLSANSCWLQLSWFDRQRKLLLY
jgi:hypothetical protein